MNRSPSLSGIAPSAVGPLLQAFFMDYMYSQKRASPRTVQSYRDGCVANRNGTRGRSTGMT